jgi:hypothetical protein
MRHALEYASPERPQSKPAIRFVPLVALLFFGSLILSLGIWSRDPTGWYSRQFAIDGSRTSWGLPHWLRLNHLKKSGTPPPMAYLPTGYSWEPGFHVGALRLLTSLTACLGVSLVASASLWLFARRGIHLMAGRYDWSLLVLVAVGAGVVGALSGTVSSDSTGLLLDFALLPLILAAASLAIRSFPSALVLAGVAIIAHWWSSRMVLLRTESDGAVWAEQVSRIGVMAMVIILVATGCTFGRRRRRTSTPTAA